MIATIMRNNSVMAVRLTNGLWGEWFTVAEATDADRNNLSGLRAPADGQSALIWMEARDGAYAIAGAQLQVF
jgi:hypothetical protein